MIRWEIFKQLTKFTYPLETDKEDRMEWSDEKTSNNWPSPRTFWWMDGGMIRREVFKQLTKFTYPLETDKKDRMRRSDEKSSNNWANSRTFWWWTEGWDGMDGISDEDFKQLTRFTYRMLVTNEEDGCDDQTRYSDNWKSSRTSWRQTNGTGWGGSQQVK